MGHLSVRIWFQYGVQATTTKEATSPDAGSSHAAAQPTLQLQPTLCPVHNSVPNTCQSLCHPLDHSSDQYNSTFPGELSYFAHGTHFRKPSPKPIAEIKKQESAYIDRYLTRVVHSDQPSFCLHLVVSKFGGHSLILTILTRLPDKRLSCWKLQVARSV